MRTANKQETRDDYLTGHTEPVALGVRRCPPCICHATGPHLQEPRFVPQLDLLALALTCFHFLQGQWQWGLQEQIISIKRDLLYSTPSFCVRDLSWWVRVLDCVPCSSVSDQHQRKLSGISLATAASVLPWDPQYCIGNVGWCVLSPYLWVVIPV